MRIVTTRLLASKAARNSFKACSEPWWLDVGRPTQRGSWREQLADLDRTRQRWRASSRAKRALHVLTLRTRACVPSSQPCAWQSTPRASRRAEGAEAYSAACLRVLHTAPLLGSPRRARPRPRLCPARLWQRGYSTEWWLFRFEWERYGARVRYAVAARFHRPPNDRPRRPRVSAGCGPRHSAPRANGWRSGFVCGWLWLCLDELCPPTGPVTAGPAARFHRPPNDRPRRPRVSAGCGPRHSAPRANGWRSGFVCGWLWLCLDELCPPTGPVTAGPTPALHTAHSPSPRSTASITRRLPGELTPNLCGAGRPFKPSPARPPAARPLAPSTPLTRPHRARQPRSLPGCPVS